MPSHSSSVPTPALEKDDKDSKTGKYVNWFQILDLDINESRKNNIMFTERDINRQYKKLALQHHPDRGGDSNLFQLLGKAKEKLLTEEKRTFYAQILYKEIEMKQREQDKSRHHNDLRKTLKRKLREREELEKQNLVGVASEPSDYQLKTIREVNRKYIQSQYKQSRKTSGHSRGKTTDQIRKVDETPENLQSKTKGSLSTATPFPFSSEVKVKWKKRENIEGEGDLYALFKQFGPIEAVSIDNSEENFDKGGSIAFGKVRFATRKAAELAVEHYQGHSSIRLSIPLDKIQGKDQQSLSSHYHQAVKPSNNPPSLSRPFDKSYKGGDTLIPNPVKAKSGENVREAIGNEKDYEALNDYISRQTQRRKQLEEAILKKEAEEDSSDGDGDEDEELEALHQELKKLQKSESYVHPGYSDDKSGQLGVRHREKAITKESISSSSLFTNEDQSEEIYPLYPAYQKYSQTLSLLQLKEREELILAKLKHVI